MTVEATPKICQQAHIFTMRLRLQEQVNEDLQKMKAGATTQYRDGCMHLTFPDGTSVPLDAFGRVVIPQEVA